MPLYPTAGKVKPASGGAAPYYRNPNSHQGTVAVDGRAPMPMNRPGQFMPQLVNQPQAPGTAAPAGQPSGGNNVNVQTSVNPQPIYNGQQTQYGVNLAHAQQMRAGNLPYLMNQFARPGMSIRSPAMMSRAVPAAAQAMSQASAAQYGIPLQDAIANSQHLLAGQTTREDEAQGLARILMGVNNAQAGFQQGNMNSLAGILAQLSGL